MDSNVMSSLTMFIPLLGVFVIMYFLIIRPQNKKEKQATAMRNSIEVGDGVTTIGGIVGPCGQHQRGHLCSGDGV